MSIRIGEQVMLTPSGAKPKFAIVLDFKWNLVLIRYVENGECEWVDAKKVFSA